MFYHFDELIQKFNDLKISYKYKIYLFNSRNSGFLDFNDAILKKSIYFQYRFCQFGIEKFFSNDNKWTAKLKNTLGNLKIE